MSCFLLSLAGAPLLGGFWGKFNIALISYKAYGLFLPSLILISALISFYYYLRIIKAIFGDKRPSQSENINFSIVNKIINDHNGKIEFIPVNNGAKVEINFNLNDS